MLTQARMFARNVKPNPTSLRLAVTLDEKYADGPPLSKKKQRKHERVQAARIEEMTKDAHMIQLRQEIQTIESLNNVSGLLAMSKFLDRM